MSGMFKRLFMVPLVEDSFPQFDVYWIQRTDSPDEAAHACESPRAKTLTWGFPSQGAKNH
jgi:hypothetical protein